MKQHYDFLVIGSGIAGLGLALKAAKLGSVALVTKWDVSEANTKYAQGGIATVTKGTDSFDKHIQDTLVAGAGICHEDAVRTVVEGGPERIKELIDLGVHFTKGVGDEYDLTREGGHSERRIYHAGDITGAEVERVLVEQVKANPDIELLEYHIAIDLITSHKIGVLQRPSKVVGAYILGIKTGAVRTVISKVTMLATGGSGKVYKYTSNPDIASGDGVAMAYRAGASIMNMEFFQFHPTCMYDPRAKNFLISEAVRGEGAILRDAKGNAFMRKYHELKDLAPRDIVARAIDKEMKRTGANCVYLDITHEDAEVVKGRFPNIYAECLKYGIDMTKELIPVVPAAHYMCGGVLTDLNGETTIKGLFAVGETAGTGLHGANRLASNSLLEALVFGHRAIDRSKVYLKENHVVDIATIPDWDSGTATDSDEAVVITHNWDEIRSMMWNYVGIVRTSKRLARAKRRIQVIMDEINEYYWNFIVTSDLIELRNIATVSKLIIDSAISRKESRGGHFTLDYPETDDVNFKHDTIIAKEF